MSAPSPASSTSSTTSSSGDSSKLTRRSHGGCLTCKIRKVKCDEEKPSCKRCTSTGRTCDGYSTNKPANHRKWYLHRERATDGRFIPKSPESGLITTTDDVHAFDCLREMAIPAISGLFHPDFWSYVVFELSKSEPIIRHAAVAIGSLHHYLAFKNIHGRVSDSTLFTDDTTPLSHYSKAITLLKDKMKDPNLDMTVVFEACILFVYFDFLRGNPLVALAQSESGLKLMQSYLNTKRKIHMNQALVNQFQNLSIQHALNGGRPTLLRADTFDDALVSKGFGSIDDARDALLRLMMDLTPFIASTTPEYRFQDFARPTNIREKQIEFQQRLTAWYDNFKLFKNRAEHHETAPVTLLDMHYKLGSVWVEVALEHNETRFDRLRSTFEEMMSDAEIVCDYSGRENHRPFFQFHPGVIPILFWVAWRCRWPLIRRKALRLLLYKASRQEGVWYAVEAAAAVARVMEIEESYDPKPPYHNGRPRSDGELPPDSFRIYGSSPIGKEAFNHDSPQGRGIIVKWKPFGPDNESHFNPELIEPLSEDDCLRLDLVPFS